MLTYTGLRLIDFYQAYISPHKGFRCAHSVVHGGTGCSGYAKQRLKDVGLIKAVPEIRARLKDCRHTAEEHRKTCKCKTHRKRKGCDADCDVCDDCGPSCASLPLAFLLGGLCGRASANAEDGGQSQSSQGSSPLDGADPVMCGNCGGDCGGCDGCDIDGC